MSGRGRRRRRSAVLRPDLPCQELLSGGLPGRRDHGTDASPPSWSRAVHRESSPQANGLPQALFTFYCVCVLLCIEHGAGKHVWDVPNDQLVEGLKVGTAASSFFFLVALRDLQQVVGG